jgi:hypothetical protein
LIAARTESSQSPGMENEPPLASRADELGMRTAVLSVANFALQFSFAHINKPTGVPSA